MCGIAGIISKEKLVDFNKQADAMKVLMFERGPDFQSAYQFKKNYTLRFFASRLKIIDLNDHANQPFHYKNLVLIFNGEIYNYKDIKKILQSQGYNFITNSDTEVLIKSFHKWGMECTKYFDGMWAFAIFDKKNEKIFLSRDNFGEKPLFLFKNNNNIIFGSEIKYIKNLLPKNFYLKINYEKIDDYLFKGYKSLNKNNKSYFQNIEKFPASSSCEICANSFKKKNKNIIDKYKLATHNNFKNLKDNIEYTKQLLFNSIQKRLISDVPLAFCLSGGIDSSALVSIAKKKFGLDPECFSIVDNDQRYNELNLIKENKKDIECKVNYIHLKKENSEKFIENLQSIIAYHDSPIATISYYVHSKISRLASKKGFKVILSGTGADELFTGYYDHYLMHLYHCKNDKKKFEKNLHHWNKDIKINVRNKFLKQFDLFIKNKNFRNHIFFDETFSKKYKNIYKKSNFKENSYCSSLLKNRMLNELFHESVPVILYEDDMNSMMHSIENRSPFLNTELLKHTMSIGESDYIMNGYNKYILRESMKGILNEKVRLNKKKIGFNTNLKNISNIKIDQITSLLQENDYFKENINFQELEKLYKKETITNSESKFVFSLLNAKIFIDKFSS
jgi:asparagine synthase (glutamine-hydrolysing)